MLHFIIDSGKIYMTLIFYITFIPNFGAAFFIERKNGEKGIR